MSNEMTTAIPVGFIGLGIIGAALCATGRDGLATMH
jgi:hypothetical protein